MAGLLALFSGIFIPQLCSAPSFTLFSSGPPKLQSPAVPKAFSRSLFPKCFKKSSKKGGRPIFGPRIGQRNVSFHLPRVASLACSWNKSKGVIFIEITRYENAGGIGFPQENLSVSKLKQKDWLDAGRAKPQMTTTTTIQSLNNLLSLGMQMKLKVALVNISANTRR